MEWDSPACEWASSLSNYNSAIKKASSQRRKSDLESLEDRVFQKLSLSIRARKPQHYRLCELQTIVKWKLQRGKWRPRLEKLASSNSENDVREASSKAFELLSKDDIKGALDALNSLRGVGPATASALLAAVDESIVFMSDEVLVTVFGERKYTTKVYLELLKKIRKKADDLQLEVDQPWTPRMVERAVYAAAITKGSPKNSTTTPKKETMAAKHTEVRRKDLKVPRSRAPKRTINPEENVRRSSRLRKLRNPSLS